MDTKIPVIVTSFSETNPSCSTPISAAHWTERAPARESTFSKDLQAEPARRLEAPTTQGEERGQDEAEGKEARAGHRG